MAEKKKAEAVEAEAMEKKTEKSEKQDEVEAFIERKMKAINEMASPAKARRAAMRVMRNRKVGK